MRYRRLGSSDLDGSEISLGSWLTYAGGVEADPIPASARRAHGAGDA
jgi:aryl-alcohol dehydrogenase-like predicted oxidoreductase